MTTEAEIRDLLERVAKQEAEVRAAHEAFVVQTRAHSKSLADTREFIRKDTLKTVFMFTLLIVAMVWVFRAQPLLVALWILLWIGAVVSRHIYIIRRGREGQRKVDAMVERDIATSEKLMNDTLAELDAIRARVLKVQHD